MKKLRIGISNASDNPIDERVLLYPVIRWGAHYRLISVFNTMLIAQHRPGVLSDVRISGEGSGGNGASNHAFVDRNKAPDTILIPVIASLNPNRVFGFNAARPSWMMDNRLSRSLMTEASQQYLKPPSAETRRRWGFVSTCRAWGNLIEMADMPFRRPCSGVGRICADARRLAFCRLRLCVLNSNRGVGKLNLERL